ncbi:LamG-like jellyroll fold domain-containing protein [Streptomyces sp. NPDC059866]|uniref:LamG-like jellyroll fold domain-containing protein n=1 Tax=Streptomyces sp. NPDC059866 TaxID=3346978 RepID=UPI003669E2A0
MAAGSGDTAGSYRFAARDSGITVPSSPSLRQLDSVRVRVRFRSDPWDKARRNLVEGHLSFALMLEGEGRLTGTVLDRTGTWSGAHVDGQITAGQWHEAALEHNGLSTLALSVDGRVVAVRHDVPGPVRPVGGFGVAIGRWPDAPEYIFRGDIGELQLWRNDPVHTVQQITDRCCGRDRTPLGKVLATLAERNEIGDSVITAARAAQAATLEFFLAVGNGREETVRELERLAGELWEAVVRRDRRKMPGALDRLRLFVAENSPPGAQDAWEQRSEEIAQSVGFGAAQRDAVLRALCLDGLRPPPDDDPRPDALPGGPWDEVRLPEQLRVPDLPGGRTDGRP